MVKREYIADHLFHLRVLLSSSMNYFMYSGDFKSLNYDLQYHLDTLLEDSLKDKIIQSIEDYNG